MIIPNTSKTPRSRRQIHHSMSCISWHYLPVQNYNLFSPKNLLFFFLFLTWYLLSLLGSSFFLLPLLFISKDEDFVTFLGGMIIVIGFIRSISTIHNVCAIWSNMLGLIFLRHFCSYFRGYRHIFLAEYGVYLYKRRMMCCLQFFSGVGERNEWTKLTKKTCKTKHFYRYITRKKEDYFGI